MVRRPRRIPIPGSRLAPVLVLLCAFGLAACSSGEGNAGSDSDGGPSLRASGVDAPPLAITDVTVVDAVDGARPGLTVVVQGDRITAVAADPEIPEGARVVDGSGRYLIPGLWDAHVHLTYDPALTEAMPSLFLDWGVTSVRDTGGLLGAVLPVVDGMRAPGADAPRVFFAGPLLDGEHVVYDGVGRPEIGAGHPTPDAARAAVAALDSAGVDFVKVYEMVSPEVFGALVDEADARGLPVASHVPLSLRAREAAPRVGSMEHFRNVELDCAADAPALLETRRELLANPEGISGAELRSSLHSLQRNPAIAAYDEATCRETIAAMSGTLQVPTLRLNGFPLAPPFAQDDWEAALERLPASVAEEWRAGAADAMRARADTTLGSWSLRLAGWLHEAGAPLGSGTDTPIGFALPGYSLHDELAMMVRAGLTPREALRTATLTPAAFFGLDGEMGRVAEGQRADLVLLAGDPLADIGNTRTIEAVISRGRVVREGPPVPAG